MRTESPPRQRSSLRALIGATYVSTLGDGAFLAAAPLAAAAITKNPSAVAVVAAAQYLPWLLISPVAGAYVDRWNKRATLVWFDSIRAVALLVLASLVLLDVNSIPALAAVAFFIVVGQIFADTATQTVVVELAGREAESLNKANGHLSSAGTLGKSLAGPPVGSLSFAVLPWLPFVLDALTFALSAVVLRRLPDGPARDSGEQASVAAAIRAGVRFLVSHRDLRILCVLVSMANLANFMSLATFVLFATERLDVTPAAYGALLAAGSVGGVAGGFAARHVVTRLGARGAITIGLIAGAIAWPMIGVVASPWIAGGILVVIEFCAAVTTVVAISARQQLTPAELLGSVISAFRTVGAGAAPLGAFIGGLIATTMGLSAPFYAAGAVLALAVLLSSQVRISR